MWGLIIVGWRSLLGGEHAARVVECVVVADEGRKERVVLRFDAEVGGAASAARLVAEDAREEVIVREVFVEDLDLLADQEQVEEVLLEGAEQGRGRLVPDLQ